MSFWKYALVGGGIALGASAIGNSGGTAQGCLSSKQRYGMKDFYNTCNYPVVIKVCTKFGVSELREAFGGKKSNWSCRVATTRPGQIGPSITWAGENASVLSSAMSSSRYIAGTCKTGYQVNIDVKSGNFTCVK